MLAAMQRSIDQWKTEDDAVQTGPGNRYDHAAKSTSLAEKYSPMLAPALVQRDSVRQQLINTLPMDLQKKYSDPTTFGYSRISIAFNSAALGQTMPLNVFQNVVPYLRALVHAISTLPTP
jgi:hypothetical protein